VISLDAPLAIVDLETTGGDPATDRITEIAVLQVDGLQLRAQWSSLVNPECAIRGEIQALTGITNDMVASAPRFPRLADELAERLEGRVFVAHNARFDYGFLRRAFERCGRRFQARTLCSVRLSRRLYPAHARHDLDSVIARHGIACVQRHRALPDAEALWQFLRLAAAEHGSEIVSVAARQIASRPRLPSHIDPAVIDQIPEAPGVYLFYGEGGAPLYIGKSLALRARVLAHFSTGARSGKALRLAQEVRRIEWERTAGELGALLREARLVKSLGPTYNRQLKPGAGACGFVFDGTRLRLAPADAIDAETLPLLSGLYRSRRAALAAVRQLADEHRLCLQALGFDSARRSGACFRHQLGRCAGVCAGKENIHLHHARVAAALAPLRAAPWPYAGPLGIVEQGDDEDATEVHVVDRWCYLGSARTDADVEELLASRDDGRFDYDHYRILSRHLARRRVRTVPLHA
jgi:DNA polymerase III subunit epsilon